MKNYLTYLIIAGGLYYFYANKKKQDQLKQLQIKPLEPIETKPKILKNIAKKVIPKVLPVIQNLEKRFNLNSTQNLFEKFAKEKKAQELIDYQIRLKTPNSGQFVKPGAFNFNKAIKGMNTFPDLC